jgi:phage protein U
MPIMHLVSPRAAAVAAALALAAIPLAHAQRSDPAITLLKTGLAETAPGSRAAALAQAANYRHFGSARVGRTSAPQVFTLAFHQAVKVTAISASNDFHISGGTCIEGHTYSAGDVCSVEMVFTPRGPGHRTGTLKVTHSGSALPLLVPTSGEADGPAVSFVPAQIETVPGTIADGTAVLVAAQGLAVDGGDSLYIADTGHNLIWYQDSSGVLSVLAGGGTNPSGTYEGPGTGVKLSAPYGVAIDSFGDAWISDTGNNFVRSVGPLWSGWINTSIGANGVGIGYCPPSAPCGPFQYDLATPYGLAFDSSGNLFVNLTSPNGLGYGADPMEDANALLDGQISDLYARFANYTETYPIAVDANDDVFYTYEMPGRPLSAGPLPPQCYIIGQNRTYSIDSSGTDDGDRLWIVAGTENCGFSGDGGLATGAEISASVQGFAWDAAGNFYFTDSGNNRVRRIDAYTGIIHTIAGNGQEAYSGDGGPAIDAGVWAPTGIAVDSRGNAYTIGTQELVHVNGKPALQGKAAPETAGGTEFFDVVREFGATGQLVFPVQLISSPSAAKTIMVSNVGNDTLNFTHAGLSAGNTGDFIIDANTTSCNFTAPLYSGENCLIGVIFKPTATGSRAATLTLLDNTATGSNIIELSGAGATAGMPVLSPATLTFPSQKAGSSSKPQKATLSNTGGFPFTIVNYSLTGTNPADFSETNNCGDGSSEAAGAADCTIDVTFTPTAAGSPTATLSVVTSSGTATLTLKGTSTAAVKPKVTLTSKTNPVATGQTVVLDANVANTSSTAKEPTGKVELKQGNAVLAEATLLGGAVTFRLSNLSAGTHVLTAYYLGDKLHEASESAAIRQLVSAREEARNR